jgi:hypothetical protein
MQSVNGMEWKKNKIQMAWSEANLIDGKSGHKLHQRYSGFA